MLSNNIDIVKALEISQRELAKNINCVKIGKIHAFYSNTQTADIELIDKYVIEDETEKHIFDYPLLVSRPVFVLSGGSSSIQMPIQKGDFCIVLINDREIDNFLTKGTGETTIQKRTHELHDCIVLVGIHPYSQPIQGYTTDGVVINSEKIKLGKNAIKGVARKGDKIDFTGVTFNGTIAGQPASGTLTGQATIQTGSTKVFSD